MPGGEPNSYMLGSPHTWWPGQPAAPLWWGARLDVGQGAAPSGPAPRVRLAPIQPGPPPKVACWLARPPGMWAAHHVWLPHHVFGFPTMYFDQGYQVSCIRVVNQNRVVNQIQGGKTKQGGKTEVSKMSPGGGTRTDAYFLVLAHLDDCAA